MCPIFQGTQKRELAMDSPKKYPPNSLSRRSSEAELSSPFLGEVFTEAQCPELENLKTPSKMFLQESPFLNVFEDVAPGLDELETQEFDEYLDDEDGEFDEEDYFYGGEIVVDELEDQADSIAENEAEDSGSYIKDESDDDEWRERNEIENEEKLDEVFIVDETFTEDGFSDMEVDSTEEEFDEFLDVEPVKEESIFDEDLEYLTEDANSVKSFIPASKLRWPGASQEQLQFMKKVYKAHIHRASKKRSYTPSLPADQLDPIEGEPPKFELRKDAASHLKDLLHAARQANITLNKNTKIQISSAYRSADRQFELWPIRFRNYYNRTENQRNRSNADGGEHGRKSVMSMVNYIANRFAAPGYSNHQTGIAVDLQPIVNGKRFINSTKRLHRKNWRKTWLWTWLIDNAATYGFYQNKNINEPWHWEYNNGAMPNKHSQIRTNPATQNSSTNLIFSLPRQLSEAVRNGLFSLQVALSILSGQRNEDKLTNMIFSARHPELPRDYEIKASEKALSREWIDIRNTSVRPILQIFQESASTPVSKANYTTSASSSSTTPRIAKFKAPSKMVERIDSFHDLIDRIAKDHGVDAHLIRGIIAAESGGKKDAGKGTNGYKGLMQCEQDNEQLDPVTSIQCGVKKYKRFERNIKNLFTNHDIDWDRLPVEQQIELVMASYNAGPFTLRKAVSYAVQGGRSALEWERPEFFHRALLYTGAYSIRTVRNKCGIDMTGNGKQKIAEANRERLRFRNVRFRNPKPAGQEQNSGLTIDEARQQGAPALMICALKFKAQNNPIYRNKILAYRKYFASRS